MKDHRKLLKKHEKVFVGVLTPEGGVVDYTNEENRHPEEPPAYIPLNFLAFSGTSKISFLFES